MNIIQKIGKRVKLDARRVLNRRTAYSYPPENDGWIKYGSQVLGGENGTFYDPFVRRVDNRYVMMVSHRNTKSIVRCDSKDGIHWSKPASVLEADEASGWEDRVNRACYWIKDGVWYLWYLYMFSYIWYDVKIGYSKTEKIICVLLGMAGVFIGILWGGKEGYLFQEREENSITLKVDLILEKVLIVLLY